MAKCYPIAVALRPRDYIALEREAQSVGREAMLKQIGAKYMNDKINGVGC